MPALAAPNIVDPAPVAAAVARALDAVGRARHVALVVPDSVAKVSLVRFEQAPPRGRDLEAMLRWQVRKSVPFRVEDAQITWADGQPLEGGGREFVVALARRDVIAQYEAALTAAGAHAGLVDLASFNLVNLLLAGGDERLDALLVHLAPDFVTLIIVRGGALIFYRHRGSDGEESLADLVHQTAMYYEDRLVGPRLRPRGSCRRDAGARRRRRARTGARTRSRIGCASRVEAVAFGDLATLSDRIAGLVAAVGRPGADGRHPGAGARRMTLRTNLSTRPFYNERAVQAVLGLAAIVVVVDHDLQHDPAVVAERRAIAAWWQRRRRRRPGPTRSELPWRGPDRA